VFIELVDALRCPRAHEESWLVLATSRIRRRSRAPCAASANSERSIEYRAVEATPILPSRNENTGFSVLPA